MKRPLLFGFLLILAAPLAAVAQQRQRTANELFADAMSMGDQWDERLASLKRARAAPFERAGERASFEPADSDGGEQFFRLRIDAALVETLCRLGLDEELTALLEKRGPELLALRSINWRQLGKTERASGSTALSDWFSQLEKERHLDVEFFLIRAGFIGGKGDQDASFDAAFKAFEVASKAGPETRSYLIEQAFTGYRIAHRNRHRTAPEAHLAEIYRLMYDPGISATMRDHAAYQLPYLIARSGLADDERLWTWVESRTTWGRSDEKILGAMMRAAREEQVARTRQRAEALAREALPGRALVMGKVLLERDYPEHAAMFLKEAAAADSGEEREVATEKLAKAREAIADRNRAGGR